MADKKYLDIIRTWAPIVLEPIAKPAGLTKAVDAFAAAAGRQADALTLFQKRPDRRVRPGAEAILLRPDRSPVPFAGRDHEVAEFEDWMFSDGWMKWRLLTGPSGRGKTRLMMGVVDRLEEIGDRPLSAGFLNLDALERNPGALGGFAAVKGDLLLAVDYAERARQAVVAVLKLALMLEKLAEAGTERRVRVVLIARGYSEMWREIGRQNPTDIDEFMRADGLEHWELPPLADGIDARNAEFDRAYAAFDAHLRKVDVTEGLPPSPDLRPDLSVRAGRDDYRDAVLIHLAALAVRMGAIDPADVSAVGLLDWIIEREQAEWDRRVARHALRGTLQGDPIREAVAAITLATITGHRLTRDRTTALVTACPLLSGLEPDETAAVVRILGDIYPGDGHTAGLGPDIVGTYLLGLLAPGFYAAVFAVLDEREATNGLTKLNWLAQSWRTERTAWREEDAARIAAAIDAAPTKVLPLVVDVALQSGEPIGRIAAEWLKENGSTELATTVTTRRVLPYPTTALREFAVQIDSALLQSTGDGQSTDIRARKATHANNLSLRLSDLGRREEALAVIEEAVRIYRSLVEVRPQAFQLDLARALNNLANRLSDLGRRENALFAVQEAVAVLRALGATCPNVFKLDLASSLTNLSADFSELGRHEEALEAAQEAVFLLRTLKAARADAFESELAGSLGNLSTSLSDVGRREEALTTVEESVAIYRALADTQPDAFLPDLAVSLHNLSVRLADLGRHEDALLAVEEALSMRRALADERPDAFGPDLATSLSNISNRLTVLGQRDRALAAVQEAIAIQRILAHSEPDAFLNDLAKSLNNLSIGLTNLGRYEEAIDAGAEAVAIRRTLATLHLDVYRPELATALNNLAGCLYSAGRLQEALVSAEEAVSLRRILATSRPDAYQPDLASALNNLSNCLCGIGHHSEALTVIEEAVLLYQALARTRPDAFATNLATSIGAHASALRALGRHGDAADRFGEGLRLLAPHLQRLTQAFAPICAALLQGHFQSLLAAGGEPDEEFLSPIVEILVEQGVLQLGDSGDPSPTSP